MGICTLAALMDGFTSEFAPLQTCLAKGDLIKTKPRCAIVLVYRFVLRNTAQRHRNACATGRCESRLHIVNMAYKSDLHVVGR